MSALFYTGEVVGYSSGIGMNPYTLEKPHTEAINIDLVTRIFPACIKDYDSASLRCCQLFPNVNYRDVESLVTKQREFVYNTIGSQCHYNQVYHLPPEGCTDVLSIPGVREAGWDEQSIMEPSKQENGLKERLSKLLSEVWDHNDSWPFRKPVNEEEVIDYRKYIKKPMGILNN